MQPHLPPVMVRPGDDRHGGAPSALGLRDGALGEALEHKRFFEQMLAGRADLLGRRADGAGTGGGVLGTRWLGTR